MTLPSRTERVQYTLRDTDLDLLALVPGSNLTYACGVRAHASERLVLLVLPRDGDPVAVVPALEASAFRNAGIRCREWRDEDGPASALAAVVDDLGGRQATWGIEFDSMTYGTVEAMRTVVPDVRFAPADQLFAELRATKDQSEIEALRRAAELSIDALETGVGTVAPGVTERDVAAEIQMRLFRNGSEGASFVPLVAGGPNSANPHAHPTDRAFQPGDVVIIDCGATEAGYQGDITRCVAIGSVSDTIRDIYEVTRRAADVARAAVRPGMLAQDIDRAARRVIEDAGYGDYFIHRTGHGLGLDIHEPPYIVGGSDTVLEAGMVFTVEPGIYLADVGGVRVEDVVVVTEEGCEIITEFPRNLIIQE